MRGEHPTENQEYNLRAQRGNQGFKWETCLHLRWVGEQEVRVKAGGPAGGKEHKNNSQMWIKNLSTLHTSSLCNHCEVRGIIVISTS